MNEGLEQIIERMKNISNKLKEKNLNILMLVPESLVSVLIGNRGQMIKKLALETKAEIVVN
jgi:transcription antitermination factor NusA-like protein